MTDDIDRANDAVQFAADLALLHHQQRAAIDVNASSAELCEECGNDIPAERRRSVPGVTLCVACKRLEEHKDRLYR